jgi:integrase
MKQAPAMSYISTNPEHSEQRIGELIHTVRQGSSPAIDGEVLANLLELCHICGLTKKELINLRIGDVISKGVMRQRIRLGRNEDPPLRGTIAENLIERHYRYLKTKGYSGRSNSPLFPAKTLKTFYDPSNLQKHLEKFYREFWGRKCLSSIRQSTICRHYDELKSMGLSPEQCLKRTAIFAGHKTGTKEYPDYRHTENVLRRLQPVNHLSDDEE